MSENAKKIGLVALIVVAVVAAVFGATRFFGGEKMEVQNTVKMPEGYKSEKQRALEAQGQAGQAASGKEADLGGALGGG